MDEDYAELLEVNADLIELMYGIRNPVAMTDNLRHPLEDIVFTYDLVMADPVRVAALASSFGLYIPSEGYRVSGYFYLALKSILYGEANNKYPNILPGVGEMFHFTPEEFEAWRKSFMAARKTSLPRELLYRFTVDDIYMDRMTVYLYYSTQGTNQDPFEMSRVSHNGETLDFTYIEEGKDPYE